MLSLFSPCTTVSETHKEAERSLPLLDVPRDQTGPMLPAPPKHGTAVGNVKELGPPPFTTQVSSRVQVRTSAIPAPSCHLSPTQHSGRSEDNADASPLCARPVYVVLGAGEQTAAGVLPPMFDSTASSSSQLVPSTSSLQTQRSCSV